MNPATYAAIEKQQLLAGQLASLLGIVARSLDAEGQGAVEACAALADQIANGLDSVPGFVEAQRLRYGKPGDAE